MPTILIGKNNPALRKKANPIDVEDDNKKSIVGLKKILSRSSNGIGLAAPQIGNSGRIFIIKTEITEDENIKKLSPDGQFFVFINPKILEISAQEVDFEEGCLSLPNLYGIVSRPEKIKIAAFNKKGDKFTMKANSYLARVIQHELDHLNGVLFIDKAKSVYKAQDEGRSLI